MLPRQRGEPVADHRGRVRRSAVVERQRGIAAAPRVPQPFDLDQPHDRTFSALALGVYGIGQVLLEGVVELTPEDGEPVTYKAGDCFVMKPGYRGLWRTIETVKKIYVVVEGP